MGGFVEGLGQGFGGGQGSGQDLRIMELLQGLNQQFNRPTPTTQGPARPIGGVSLRNRVMSRARPSINSLFGQEQNAAFFTPPSQQQGPGQLSQFMARLFAGGRPGGGIPRGF